jgi:hypothetical protein
MIASTKRLSDTSPNWVSLNNVDNTFHVMASPNGSRLIDTASNKSQIAPDIAAIAKLIHAV